MNDKHEPAERDEITALTPDGTFKKLTMPQPAPYPNGPQRPKGFDWRTALEQLSAFAKDRRR
jgi:hypothetical protein